MQIKTQCVFLSYVQAKRTREKPVITGERRRVVMSLLVTCQWRILWRGSEAIHKDAAKKSHLKIKKINRSKDKKTRGSQSHRRHPDAVIMTFFILQEIGLKLGSKTMSSLRFSSRI